MTQAQTADGKSWAMLVLLSAIWGGSFMFIAIAVKELAALEIVLARVAIAAALILPAHLLLQGPLPRDAKTWIAAAGMAVMNNILPFTLITWGQHFITGGLASVINATTPMFTAVFMVLFALEAVSLRKTFALLVGFVGVVILQGASFEYLSASSHGIMAVVLAAMFYGLSAPWSKTMLVGIPPITTATCQLLLSTLGMGFIVLLYGDVTQYQAVTLPTWLALLGLAGLSTSLAYLLFFNIIKRAGPSFSSLCTMIIPVFAIALGYVFLGERLTANEVVGALVIGLALIIIDGRLLAKAGLVKA